MELEPIILKKTIRTKKRQMPHVFSHLWMLALNLKLCMFHLGFPETLKKTAKVLVSVLLL